MAGRGIKLFPEGKSAHRQQALSWDQVKNSLYKLGRYGFSGIGKKDQGKKTSFHRLMSWVIAGTGPACQRLWEKPHRCEKILKNIQRGNWKLVTLDLETIGIKVVFHYHGSQLTNYFGIYLKISELKNRPEEDSQRVQCMEYGDFVRALAWAKEDLLTQ